MPSDTHPAGEQVYERLMRAGWWASLTALLAGIGALFVQVPLFTVAGWLLITGGILGWAALTVVRIVARTVRG